MPTFIPEYFLPENKKVYVLLELIDQVNNRIEFRLFRVLFWKIFTISNEVVPFIASDKYPGNVIFASEIGKEYMHVVKHDIFVDVSDNYMQHKIAELAVEYKNLPVDLYYYMDDICYAYSVQETE